MNFSLLGEVLKESQVELTEDGVKINKNNKKIKQPTRQVLSFECETINKQLMDKKEKPQTAEDYQEQINQKQQQLNNEAQSVIGNTVAKSKLDKLVTEMTMTTTQKPKKMYEIDLQQYQPKQKQANITLEDLQPQFDFMNHLMIPQAIQDQKQGKSILNTTKRHQSQAIKQIINAAPQKLTDEQRQVDLAEYLQLQRLTNRQPHYNYYEDESSIDDQKEAKKYEEEQKKYQQMQKYLRKQIKQSVRQTENNQKVEEQLQQLDQNLQLSQNQVQKTQQIQSSKYQNDKIIQYCKNKRQQDEQKKQVLDQSKQIRQITQSKQLKGQNIQYSYINNQSIKPYQYQYIPIQSQIIQNKEKDNNDVIIQQHNVNKEHQQQKQIENQQVNELQVQKQVIENKQQEQQQVDDLTVDQMDQEIQSGIRISKVYESDVYDFKENQNDQQVNIQPQQQIQQETEEEKRQKQQQEYIDTLKTQLYKQGQELAQKMQKRIQTSEYYYQKQQQNQQQKNKKQSTVLTEIQNTKQSILQIKENLLNQSSSQMVQSCQETVEDLKHHGEILTKFSEYNCKKYERIQLKSNIQHQVDKIINHLSAEIQILAIKIMDMKQEYEQQLQMTKQKQQIQNNEQHPVVAQNTTQTNQTQQLQKQKSQLKLNKIGQDREIQKQLQMLVKTKTTDKQQETVQKTQTKAEQNTEKTNNLILSGVTKFDDRVKYFLNDGVVYIYKDGQEYKATYSSENIQRLEDNKIQIRCHNILDKSYDLIIEDNKELFKNL